MNSENRVLAGENEMTKLWLVIAMGWYLMGPPIDDKGVVLPEAPLRKWSHVASFDSARECQTIQFMRERRAYKVFREVQDDVRTGRATIQEQLGPSADWAFASRSQCVNSGDPRLR